MNYPRPPLTRKKSRSFAGFTLIELMVVVAVIGILALVAIPKFATLLARSREGAVRGSLGKIRSALSIYFADTDGAVVGDPNAALVPTFLERFPTVSLPAIDLFGNPGHQNISGAAAGDVSDMTDASDGVVWFFFNRGAYAGQVVINCSHLDSRGEDWSSH